MRDHILKALEMRPNGLPRRSMREILVDGRSVGTVYRGWLRLGGDQWVISAPELGLSTTGEKTLKDVERRIERAAS